MITKEILCFGKKRILACDGKCDKAWGISIRKTILLDREDVDDIAFLSDDELEIAPINPGTYEGSCGKPVSNFEKLNKWCFRECERSSLFNIDETNIEVKLKDFSKRLFNIPIKIINLPVIDGQINLIGFEEGKAFYRKYLQHKIYSERTHIIKIGENIQNIDVHFVNGLIEEASLNGIKKEEFKKIISFDGKKSILHIIDLAFD